jgi:hypothetical protein
MIITSITSSSIPFQSQKLALQNPLQRTPIITEMRHVKRLSGPGSTSIVLIAAVQIHGVIESSCGDPFELFCGIWSCCLNNSYIRFIMIDIA